MRRGPFPTTTAPTECRFRSPEEVATPEPERIDRRRAALVAYDVCRRALAPSDPARRAAMRPVRDAWVQMIAAARGAGRAGDLHDASQPLRWRRRRHAADRPFGGDRRAATH